MLAYRRCCGGLNIWRICARWVAAFRSLFAAAEGIALHGEACWYRRGAL
jgi:hypothetical protein